MDILVLHDDDFGAALAARLRMTLPGRVAAARLDDWPDPDALDQLIAGARHVVFAWSRPVPRLETAVDRAVLRHRATLLPVVAEAMSVRVGPRLTPDTPATVDCYYRRRAQRAGAHARLGTVHEYFDDHPAGEPAGHLAATVAIAAAAAAGFLTAGQPGEARLALIHPHTGLSTSSVLLGVHGNARSRAPFPPGQRTFARLRGIVRDAMGVSA
ncbi:hypothetical protein F9C11_26690 [Amycolatopsis sp. VS8301801F10]|uniref:hypothetical protein n=1 Tax=Amycolatopsis sp. VS8301801F10 TaxID=2652442 RepID=UPI0038FC530E